MAPHILTLPRELRDRVFEEVLETSPYVESEPLKWVKHPGLSLPQQAVIGSSSALLLVNRQLRAEVLSRIAAGKGCTYSLDLTLRAADHEKRIAESLDLTWTTVPILPITHARRIHVSVQPIIDSKVSWRAFNFGGDGGPGETTQCLLHVMARFLVYGPSFEESKHEKYPKVGFVEELVLDMLPMEFGVNYQPTQAAKRRDPEDDVITELGMFLGMVARSGLVEGRIGRFLVMQSGQNKADIVVVKRAAGEVAGIAKEWAEYGWIWVEDGKVQGRQQWT